MKATGMTRPIDELGRIVLPIELRRSAGLKTGDRVDISTDGNRILLNPVRERCVFCGSVDTLREKYGEYICEACINDLAKQ